MNWISCKDKLPETPCNLICLISGEIFLGEAVYTHAHLITFNSINFIYYRINRPITSYDAGKFSGTWCIPNYFREVTHWMPIPELPGDC